MLKFKIKKELNIHELSYLFEDIIKTSDSITDKHYYKKLFVFIKDYYYNEFINSFKDIIEKKYVILLQNEDNKYNINQNLFTNYVYLKKYGTNILVDKYFPEIDIGNIKFEKITLCPSLYWKYLYFKDNLFNLNVYPYAIYNVWNEKLLTTKINNPNDYLIINNLVSFYNKLEIFYNFKFFDINTIDINNEFSFGNLAINTFDSHIDNISYISTDLLDFKYKLIKIKNEHYINIINKFFPSSIIKKFNENYNIFKDFEKALPKEYYNKLLLLYKQENEFNKAYLQNKCEHYKLIKNNKIKEIIELYIDKKKDDITNLEQKNTYFQCSKCNFNLICPHTVFKFLNKKKNLNAFIELFENRENTAFCRICGEKLYETSYGYDIPIKSDIMLSFEGMSTPEDILKKHIYIETNFIINNFITKNKYIYNDDILQYVYNHVYDKLFNIINIIHKDKTSSNYIKTIKFQLLIHIYCIASIAIIATTFPNFIKLFNNKTTQIKNLIPLIINNVMQNKLNIINKLKFTQNQIETLTNEVLNKLINNIPKFMSIKDVSINSFILNDIYENIFYNYIFIINKILYGTNFDIEIVLNTNLNDIVINKNNIFLPNFDFLKVKKGGIKPKEMIPLFTTKDISNLSKKLIKAFTNDKIVNDNLQANPFFIELKKNIELIHIDYTKTIYSIIIYTYLNNYNSIYKIFYNKPNFEINNILYPKLTYDYLKNIKYQVLITDDEKIKNFN